MDIKEKTPLDIIIISLFLLWTSSTYFGVNKNIIPFYGFVIHGKIANTLWLISCIIYFICAVGLYKRYYMGWKLLMGYSVFQLGNSFMNSLFISNEQMLSIMTNGALMDCKHPVTDFYSSVFLFFEIVFIVYLFKRKRIFMKNRITNEDNPE
jgi:hypothetical protein